jgi:hypothetical protein
MNRRGFVARIGAAAGFLWWGGAAEALHLQSGTAREMVPDDWYEAGLTYLRGMNSGQSAYRAAKGRLADVTTLRAWDAVLQSKFDKKVRDRFGTLLEASKDGYRILIFEKGTRSGMFTDENQVIYVGVSDTAQEGTGREYSDFRWEPIRRDALARRSPRWLAPLDALAAFFFPVVSADHFCLCGHCQVNCHIGTSDCVGCGPDGPYWCCNLGFEDCKNCCACKISCSPFDPCID